MTYAVPLIKENRQRDKGVWCPGKRGSSAFFIFTKNRKSAWIQ